MKDTELVDAQNILVAHTEVEARNRFLELLQGLDAIVWEMDVRTWQFTFVSDRALQLLGYPTEHWLQKPNFWQNNLLHPEDRDWCLAFCQSQTQQALDHEFEYRAVAADGRVVWLKDFVRVIRDEDANAVFLRGIMVDITKEKEAEERDQQLREERTARLELEKVREELRRSEQRYRSLVEATAQIVWDAPIEGVFVTPQPSWSAFTGQTFEELKGWGWLNAVHPEDREHTAQVWSIAIAQQSLYQVEHRLRRYDGAYRYMSVRATPVIGENGQICEWVGVHTDITEAKKAQETLRQEQEFKRVLVENFSEGVVACDAEGNLTLFNRIAREWHGIDPTSIPPEEWGNYYSLYEADGVTPLTAETIPLLRAFRGESVRQVGMSIVAKGQPPRYLLASGDALFDGNGHKIGAVVIMYDITKLREAEEARDRALAEAEAARAELHRVFMQAPAAIATSRGANHVYETANNLYYQISGRNNEILGQPVHEIFPELEEQGFFAILDQVYQTGEPFVGKEVPAKFDRNGDGKLEESYWNLVYQPLLNASGQVYGIMNHAVEVTEQVRSRQEIEKKAEELTQLTQALERSNRELDQFAYIASHDLKAPLRAIAKLSEWLEEDLEELLDESCRQQMNLLRGRVHRMEALIDGILAYSRAGRGKNEIQEVNLGELLSEVVEMLSPSPEIQVVIDPQMPVFRTERVPLEQIFLNLISNAIKYIQNPQPQIKIQVREIEAFYEFSVTDNGPGISPEYHQKIWGIFQRLEARDQVEGTGIGLSIVKKLVESRGGKVGILSEIGVGSTFYFLWRKFPFE